MSEAYQGRQSTSTRNPHAATLPVSAKELARLSPEERVLRQWKAAFGAPISDEAKVQFCIHLGDKAFELADARLWQAHYNNPKLVQDGGSSIFLEFFFDGMISELAGQEDAFTAAFESMIQKQLQEVRITEFRKRLTARKRANGRRNAAAEDGGVEGGGACDGDESEWKDYLKRQAPAVELSVRAMREAGCMLRFLVCQTSISASAAEALGQIAFQEHFPIDGVQQEPSGSKRPLPRWVYWMLVLSFIFVVVTIIAWWQVVKAYTWGAALPSPGGAKLPTIMGDGSAALPPL